MAARSIRLQLLVPDREEWDRYRDPKKEGVLFCPSSSPPETGARVGVDVVFQQGPRVRVRGRVVWRRPSADCRVPMGVGVEVDPQDRPTLRYLASWSKGELPERRVHPRLPIRLRVTYGVKGQHRVNFTRDLSASGVYIHCALLLEENDAIQVALAPPSGSSPLPLVGCVRRCDTAADSPGMAIQLLFEGPAEQHRFAAFVHELARQMGSGQLPEQYFSLA